MAPYAARHASVGSHRSRDRSVSQLSVHSLLTQVGVYLLSFPASVLVARAVGPIGRGGYYLPLTLVTILFTVGSMGTVQAQFKLWRTGYGEDEFKQALTILTVVLGIIFTAVGFGTYMLLRGGVFFGVPLPNVLIALAALPVQIATSFAGGLLSITGRLRRSNAALFAGAVVQLMALVAVFLTGRLSVREVLIVTTLSAFVVGWIAIWGVQPSIRVGKTAFELSWRLIRVGITIQPYVVLAYLNLRVDTVLLAHFGHLADVGLYSVAVVFAEIVWVASDALTFAVVRRQANDSNAEVLELTARAVRLNVVVTSGLGVVVAVFAPWVEPSLFGHSFERAVPATLLLLPASVLMAAWKPVAAPMIRMGGGPKQSGYALLAVVVNAGVNLLLIPRLGLVGASLASLCSYGVGAVLMLRWLRAKGRMPIRDLIPRASDLGDCWSVALRMVGTGQLPLLKGGRRQAVQEASG